MFTSSQLPALAPFTSSTRKRGTWSASTASALMGGMFDGGQELIADAHMSTAEIVAIQDDPRITQIAEGVIGVDLSIEASPGTSAASLAKYGKRGKRLAPPRVCYPVIVRLG